MDEDIVIARIYIHEADHPRRTSLLTEILTLLREHRPIESVVVLRGIAGLNSHGEVHAADILRLNVDLPLVVEFFDRPDAVEAALKALTPLVPDDHPILCWTARRRGKLSVAGKVKAA